MGRRGGGGGAAGHWERPISTFHSIVGYVAHVRGWLPDAVGGTLWFAPHAAATSVYTPFAVGMESVPQSYTNATMGSVDRGNAWWASRYLYNLLQLKWSYMIQDVRALQLRVENASAKLQARLDATYRGPADLPAVTAAYSRNADAAVRAQWRLADDLMVMYADGYCHSCGRGPYRLGYPDAWLRAANFSGGGRGGGAAGGAAPQHAATAGRGVAAPPRLRPLPVAVAPADAAAAVRRCVRACAAAADDAGGGPRLWYDGQCVDACIE